MKKETLIDGRKAIVFDSEEEATAFQDGLGYAKQVLGAENEKLLRLLNDIIRVSDEQKAIQWSAYRYYEDEVYAVIEKAKKELEKK